MGGYKMKQENKDLILSMWDDLSLGDESNDYIWNIISDTLNIDIDSVRDYIIRNRFQEKK
jgi:hypothetical protein